MDRKKRLIDEIICFIFSILLGIFASLLLYRLLGVDLNLVVLVLGVLITLIAVYVIRLTMWIFKKNM